MKKFTTYCIFLFYIGFLHANNYELKLRTIDFEGGISKSNSYSLQAEVKDIHSISTSNSYAAAYGFVPQTYNVNLYIGKLTFEASPIEGGSTEPSGQQDILSGQSITIKATPNASYIFTKWTGNGDILIESPTSAETT